MHTLIIEINNYIGNNSYFEKFDFAFNTSISVLRKHARSKKYCNAADLNL